MDQLDTNYKNLTKTKIIQKYQRNLNEIQSHTTHYIDDKNFYTFLTESQLTFLAKNCTTKKKLHPIWLIQQKRYVSVIIVLVMYIYFKTDLSNMFMRQIQPFIYPGMSYLRRLTLPMLIVWPKFSQLYDETCLITNPMFHINDFDCYPCENVITVLDFSNIPEINNTVMSSVPFIYKENSSSSSTASIVTLEILRDMYAKDKTIFDQNTRIMETTSIQHSTFDMILDDLLVNRTLSSNENSNNIDDDHYTLFQCNRMISARLLRKTIGHANRLPLKGLSVERYLTIDKTISKSHAIPNIQECSIIFIRQLNGSRKYILRPSAECRHKCLTVSVHLPESYVCKFFFFNKIKLL